MRSVSAVVVGWLFFVFMGEASVAEKIRVGFVSPAPGLPAPWIAKETGGLARHGLDADVIPSREVRDWYNRSSPATFTTRWWGRRP